MHKDTPPGLFDIADRPLVYVIWLGLGTGFALSVIVNLSYLLAKDNATKRKTPWSSAAQPSAAEIDSPK